MDLSQDELLIAELREALATVDPVPEHVIAGAKASLSWRRIDEELAELIADSAIEPVAAARVFNEPTQARLLTFEAPGLTVEVEVTPVGESCRLVGQLVPPQGAPVEVCWPGGSVDCQADSVGLFSVSSVPAGPVSMVCYLDEGKTRVVTSWVTL